jgi:hypothetical protein
MGSSAVDRDDQVLIPEDSDRVADRSSTDGELRHERALGR